jgi:uncharacterized DUF497 family protein
MRVVWDPRKAQSNARKHGVTFEEALTALDHVLAVTYADPAHSLEESRSLTFGLSAHGRILVVAHADRGDTIRLISARVATKSERRQYEEG